MGFNFNPVIEEIMNALITGCPGIEFDHSMIDGPENAEKLKAADQVGGNIDGYLVIQMNGWNETVQQLCETGEILYGRSR